MKVLLATPLLAPDIGGPATYSKIILDELPKMGVTIETAYFGDVRHKSKVIRHFAYFILVLKKAWRADIIYALDPVSVGFPARLAAYLAGKKFMVRIAGDYAWEQGVQRFGVTDSLDDFSKQSGYGFKVSLLKFIQFAVASSASHIIVPSNYFKGIIANWGVSEKKLKVIYSVFEFKEKIEDKQVCRDRLGIHGITLFASGRLVPWKGFPMLIELMSELKNKYLEIKLFIAGDGPDRDELVVMVRRYGLEDYVVLLGQLDKQTLTQYMRASDVFLLNTSYEGFSHQLLEVMAVGTPIVTTPVGGNIELIKDGVSGLFAPYNDKRQWTEKVTSLIDNPTFAESVVSGAKRKTSLFTVDKMITELMVEFENVRAS